MRRKGGARSLTSVDGGACRRSDGREQRPPETHASPLFLLGGAVSARPHPTPSTATSTGAGLADGICTRLHPLSSREAAGGGGGDVLPSAQFGTRF